MQNFIKKICALAAKNPKKIVFPDGGEDRILQALEIITGKNLAHPVLLGESRKIKSKAKKMGLKINWKKVEIIAPEKSKKLDEYGKLLYELRKDKGMKKKEAGMLAKEPGYFACLMLHENDADGIVTGTTHSTADSIRPALQIIKTKEKFHKVSGIFFMVLEKRLLLFADAAITIEPNSYELMQIAIDTANTARKFDIEPKIAMLSFSTLGSARHPKIDKIRESIAMIKDKEPDLIIDGEMQVDAAIVPEVAKRKCPDSPIKGDANILIFPNLEAANIAYKLVERLAKAKAVGPILQGLKKPVNDLSRGCSYKDIANITAFTSIESESD